MGLSWDISATFIYDSGHTQCGLYLTQGAGWATWRLSFSGYIIGYNVVLLQENGRERERKEIWGKQKMCYSEECLEEYC